MRLKQEQPATNNTAAYQEIIRKLLECNESLTKTCKKHFILIESVHLWATIYSQK
jgi:hypothetical protein